ncbi:hypothetical protein PanWU01x14_089810, partial [Parasponia andersonii]
PLVTLVNESQKSTVHDGWWVRVGAIPLYGWWSVPHSPPPSISFHLSDRIIISPHVSIIRLACPFSFLA